MSLSARSNAGARGYPSANFGVASLAIGFLALLYVAPLSAQSAKSLLDLLTNPQVQDMPPLVRAANDGAMLAGKLIVETVPRVTLTVHRGDKIAPADPQRLAAASPDITSPTRIEGARLPSHFLTTENEAERAVLEVIFAGKIPDHFKNIEPAANAPKVDFLKPGLLSVSAAATPHPAAPQPETASILPALSALAALAADLLDLPDGFKSVPPPLVRLVAVQPTIVPAATPDLTALAAVPATPGLAAEVPPTIKGQLVVPDAGPVLPDTKPVTDVPVTDPPVVALTGNALDLAMQAELKRLNCYAGTVDGSFGPGSQGALDLFFQKTKRTRSSTDLTQAVLDQLKAVDGKACLKPYAVVVVVQRPIVPTTPPQPPKPPIKDDFFVQGN